MKTKSYALLLASYLIWGFMPFYWAIQPDIDPFFLMAGRTIWGAVFTLAALAVTGRLKELAAVFKNPRVFRWLCFASLFMLLDNGFYIYAVHAGHVLDTSLGYYLAPLIMFFCGVLFFRERCRWFHLAALGLAMAGVVLIAVFSGGLPVISLCLAVFWALCAMGQKKAGIDSFVTVGVEMLLQAPLYMLFVLFFRMGSNGMASVDIPRQMFLIGAGVITAVPVLTYVGAVKKLSMATMAFGQYLMPTFSMICALMLGERLPGYRLAGLIFIWAGLILYSALTFINDRKHTKEVSQCKLQETTRLSCSGSTTKTTSI